MNMLFKSKSVFRFLVFNQRKYTQAKANFSIMKSFSVNDVLFDNYFGLRMITLNRPEKLNALSIMMVRNIYDKLIVIDFL